MFRNSTLSIYLFKSYFLAFFLVLSVLTLILLVSNSFDILQKFKSTYVPTSLLWRFIIYKIPYLINEISVLLSFIAMLLFLLKLIRHNELISMLCGGMSLWSILMVPICATILIGIIITTIVNPLGVYGLKKYEQLEKKLVNKTNGNNLTISVSGIFFYEEYKNERRIIHAKSISLLNHTMQDVVMLFLDEKNNYIKRIDAKQATIIGGTFEFNTADVIVDNITDRGINLIIPTKIAIDNLMNSFMAPEMISFWDLSQAIDSLFKFGLPSINYQLYYYKQLFKPLSMAATALISCCFISLNTKSNSYKKMLVNGVLSGFLSYATIEIMVRILLHHGVKPLLAVLLPVCLIIIIGNYIILHLHEA